MSIHSVLKFLHTNFAHFLLSVLLCVLGPWQERDNKYSNGIVESLMKGLFSEVWERVKNTQQGTVKYHTTDDSGE